MRIGGEVLLQPSLYYRAIRKQQAFARKSLLSTTYIFPYTLTLAMVSALTISSRVVGLQDAPESR